MHLFLYAPIRFQQARVSRKGWEKEGGMEINNKRIGEWVEKEGGMEEEEHKKGGYIRYPHHHYHHHHFFHHPPSKLNQKTNSIPHDRPHTKTITWLRRFCPPPTPPNLNMFSSFLQGLVFRQFLGHSQQILGISWPKPSNQKMVKIVFLQFGAFSEHKFLNSVQKVFRIWCSEKIWVVLGKTPQYSEQCSESVQNFVFRKWSKLFFLQFGVFSEHKISEQCSESVQNLVFRKNLGSSWQKPPKF